MKFVIIALKKSSRLSSRQGRSGRGGLFKLVYLKSLFELPSMLHERASIPLQKPKGDYNMAHLMTLMRNEKARHMHNVLTRCKW